MTGFAELINAMGGVRLCLPGELVDPLFGDQLRPGEPSGPLVLAAGCHRYGGLDALAYARSRQGHIVMPDGRRLAQTDFDRVERQQSLLVALRNELADSDLIFELPAVLSAIARTVDTDFPRDRAGDLASLLPLITGPDIKRVVLDYPQFVDAPAQPDVNYLLEPRRNSIREEMARLFGEDELRGWYLATKRASP
jgi:anionic cell wall polymer biosynthesis LytR-Cps2A-Psr (LCP) family protein